MSTAGPRRLAPEWPLYVIALPAIVAIWSGWVGLGGLSGFGVVHPFPGFWDSAKINISITLPIGVEAYAGYAMWVALGERSGDRPRAFAGWSTAASLTLGTLGQIAYHLMIAAGWTQSPWWITAIVSALPVVVVGAALALAHLVRSDRVETARAVAAETLESERLRLEAERSAALEAAAEETRKVEAEAARMVAEVEAGRIALAQAEAATERERLRAERAALAAVGNQARKTARTSPETRRATASETASDLPRRTAVRDAFLATVGGPEEWSNARLATELYGVTEPSAKQVDAARVNARNWCSAAGVVRAGKGAQEAAGDR